MREVFLDNLPKRGNNIDWKSSVGHSISFIYSDIEGEIEILAYNKKSEITAKYNDTIFDIKTDNLLNCKLGKKLNKITRDFRFDILLEVKTNNRDLVIVDREYRIKSSKRKKQYKKYYKYICNKCGYSGWILESNLINECGCACCTNKVAVLGINTIYDTDPWMMELGVSEEVAKRYTRGSGKKVEVTCPDCGNKKEMRLSTIYDRKSICCTCGDSFSYPEKFMSSILKQLNVEYVTQLSKTTFDWCDKYRYDFYIPSLNMIIETHGMQHYEESGRKSARTLQEEQRNDKLKRELALYNGIKHYIIVDCKYSDSQYIKNSILNSKLNELFDLSNIDWLKCEEFALKNLVKEVCEYWNQKEEWETTTNLSLLFNIHDVTIRKYLERGTRLKWCSYDPKKEVKKVASKSGKLNSKQVEIFKDDVSLGVFDSVAELERQSEELFGVKLIQSGISQVCLGIKEKYKNFKFKYI